MTLDEAAEQAKNARDAWKTAQRNRSDAQQVLYRLQDEEEDAEREYAEARHALTAIALGEEAAQDIPWPSRKLPPPPDDPARDPGREIRELAWPRWFDRLFGRRVVTK